VGTTEGEEHGNSLVKVSNTRGVGLNETAIGPPGLDLQMFPAQIAAAAASLDRAEAGCTSRDVARMPSRARR